MQVCVRCNEKLNSDNGCGTCETSPDQTKSKLFLPYKLAGIAFIINGILLLVEGLMISEDLLPQELSNGIGSIVIGFLLTKGRKNILKFAQISIILGALYYSAVHAANSAYHLIALQLLFSIPMIGLLAGKARKIRTVISTVLLIIFFSLSAIGTIFIATGHNPLSKLLVKQMGLIHIQNTQIMSQDSTFSLTVPNKQWMMRTRDAINKDNPLASMWFVNPKQDAHVIVIHERVAPTQFLPQVAYEDAILDAAKNYAKNFDIMKRVETSLPSKINGSIIDVEANVNYVELKYKYGIFTHLNNGFQIVCFSGEHNFSTLQSEFQEIIKSLEFHESVLNLFGNASLLQ